MIRSGSVTNIQQHLSTWCPNIWLGSCETFIYKLVPHYFTLICGNKQIQVNNIQKISFVYHFIKEFEQKFYMTVLLWRIICKLIDKMSNTRFSQDINLYDTYLNYFLKVFIGTYNILIYLLNYRWRKVPYENYGNLNSKICQLLDIFCWVRKKETFSLAFLHSSLRVVCEEGKQWAQNLFEI